MDISFYNYSGMNNVLQKTLSPVKTITDAKPFHPLSPLTGELILDYNVDIFSANYCSFRDKYYFVTDRELMTGQRMRIICRVDVLMSYSDGIKTAKVIPYRSQSDYNRYIIDTTQPIDVRTEHFNLLFNGANLDYNNMSLIAGIVGTGGTPTDN